MNEQLDLFGFAPSQYIIKKPIRLIELFAGIGAQSKALEVLKANFESYKLMGFTQVDYEKCAKIQSNATIYHQAGDSIVVTVLIAIFGKLLGVDYEKVIKEYVKGEILNESEYNI